MSEVPVGQNHSDDADFRYLSEILSKQKHSWFVDGVDDYETRIARIQRCIDFLYESQDAIVTAAQKDWINKDADLIRLSEVMIGIVHAKHVKKHLHKWMKREKRRPDFPFNLLGSKSYILYQPIGVVGVMVPWNGPISTAMIGIIDAFSAGNRVMVKMSELSPEVAKFMSEVIPKYFKETELAIIDGDVSVSRAFSELPFDHLIFTGSSSTARHIMAAAAKNLVPVTLELGGKCPVYLSSSVKDFDAAVSRMVAGRLGNSGQGCITPDYVLVAKELKDQFVKSAVKAIEAMYPKSLQGRDYSSMANDAHYARVLGMIAQAKNSGAELIEIDVGGDAKKRQIAPTLAINPPEGTAINSHEIFGPIFSVFTVSNVAEAVAFINSRPRPLALYYFGEDRKEKDFLLTNTVSGGACVNDVLVQLAMEDLPFGGVGESGIGNYWGGDAGFKRLSHPKSVFEQGYGRKLTAMMDPPYGDRIKKLLKFQLKP